jgi:hypothetical protein
MAPRAIEERINPQPLSPATRLRLDAAFAPELRAAAEQMLLHGCGSNLPLLDELDSVGLERYRYAALKLSGGDLTALRDAIELARRDWRDLLVAAGFGHDPGAHRGWFPPQPSKR